MRTSTRCHVRLIARAALLATPLAAFAAAPPGFDAWRDGFRLRALAKGVQSKVESNDQFHGN